MNRNIQDPKMLSYLENEFPEPNSLFAEAKRKSQEINKEYMRLSAQEGRMIGVLAGSIQCKKAVEIGTLTGYSALWILWGMASGGQLWTMEKDPTHAGIARDILGRAKFSAKAEVVEGDAEEKLLQMNSKGPFDFVFIDGNKSAYPFYLEWTLKNLRPGGMIIADNVFLSGSVYGVSTPEYSEKQAQGLREFNKLLADDTKFRSMIFPTAEGLMVSTKL
jgi:predicted O-methyltransferase YrrM